MASRSCNRRLITTTVTALLLFLLSCCSYIHVASANFLATPSPKWSIQLQGSGRLNGRGLRKGNAIVAHKDGTKIFVTANDGSLHIIQTTNQVRTLAVYVPDEKNGSNVECSSGVSIVYSKHQGRLHPSIDSEEEKEDFVVYAVIDNAQPTDAAGDSSNENGRDGTKSRVIAVNMDGTLKWSVNVPGRIEGTPIVGKTGIYVTHNYNGYGTMTIIRYIRRLDGSVTIVGTVATFAEDQGKTVPFGPPTLRKSADLEDENDSEDVIIVAENWQSGFSESKGGLYMLSSSSIPAAKGKGDDKSSTETATSDEHELVQISSWSYSASAPPLVFGESIFMGAAGGTIAGFTGDRKNDLSGITSGREDEISPRWDYQVSPNPRNASQPIQNQPVLDSEGEYLFVSGVDSDMYCFQSDNGRELWRAEGGSQILARPLVSEREDRRKVVYTIETQNGRVRQYDLYSGRRYWDYSCADISNQMCQDAVEADFAITPSGNTIYYGDINGRIFSLAVANFETETPTIAPTSTPTGVPSGKPTISETPSQMPQAESSGLIIINDGYIDNSNSSAVTEGTSSSNAEITALVDQQATKGDSNKIAVYIGAAIAGLCVLMIPIVIFSMLRRRRKKPTSSKDMVVEIIDDCSSDDVESQADLKYLNSIETNNSCDPNSGDGIEVEIINHFTSPTGNPTKDKKTKKRKGSLPDTPNTVNSLDSIEENLEDSSAMVVVGKQYDVADMSVEAVNLRKSFDQVAESRAVTSSDHLEPSIGNSKNSDENTENVNDSSYFSDDDVPPPPPVQQEAPPSPSSKEWTWGSLLQIGTSQSSEKPNSSSQISLKKPSENLESNQYALATSPSQDESSTSMSTGSQRGISIDGRQPVQKETILPVKKKKWRKKNRKNPSTSLEFEKKDQAETPVLINQNEESQTSNNEEFNGETSPEQALVSRDKSEIEANEEVKREPSKNLVEEERHESEEPFIGTQSLISPPQTPTSPSAFFMPLDADQSKSPAQSIQSLQDSMLTSQSVGSDDDSLYTSHTGNKGGLSEKEQYAKDSSPLSAYVFDQDVFRRGRSEIVNEGKTFLAQPVLSKFNSGVDTEEHPDDEIAITPESQYLSEEMKGQKYGRSVRSKQDSNSFRTENSSENESGRTSIAQMYDQLAAIGQQRREEKKPAFRRRNKRMERENITPSSQQEEEQEGDTWGSFMNELAEVEKEFFTPSASKSKPLSNASGSDDTKKEQN